MSFSAKDKRLKLSSRAPEMGESEISIDLQGFEGDDIEILVADERRFEVRRKPSRAELLERLRAYRGRLPPDFRFDRLEANEGRG